MNIGNPTNYAERLQVKTSGNKVYVIKQMIAGYDHDQVLCFDLIGNPVTTFGNNGIVQLNQNGIPQSSESRAAISADGNIYLISGTKALDTPQNRRFLAINLVGFDPSLSLQEEISKSNLIVFPNPTTGILQVQTKVDFNFEKIEVLDFMGKVVMKEFNFKNDGLLDLSNLNSGIYIIKIFNDMTVSTHKIIKI